MNAAQLRRLWRAMPGRQSVTLRRQTARGVYADSAVSDCWWRQAEQGEAAASAGAYLHAARTWYVPLERLPTAPNPGDLIAATPQPGGAATTFTVLGVGQAGGLGCWQLDTLSLSIRGALSDAAAFERPSMAQDAAGRQALASWSAVASGVACRLQPEGADAEEVFDRVATVRRFTLFLPYRIDVRARDRVTVGADQFTVVSLKNSASLTELPSVSLERIG